VLELLDPGELGRCLQADGAALLESVQGQLISLDGKKIKGVSPRSRGNQGLYILSAWVGEQRLSIGQQKVGDKSNEITAIPKLLRMLDVRGAIVSIDAVGCQVAIAAQIQEQGAGSQGKSGGFAGGSAGGFPATSVGVVKWWMPDKLSLQKRRFRAALNQDYLMKVLGNPF